MKQTETMNQKHDMHKEMAMNHFNTLSLRQSFARRLRQSFAGRSRQSFAGRSRQSFAGRSRRSFAGRSRRSFARPGQLALLLGALLAMAACNKPGPAIDRVQTNLVDKDIFQGEWWILQSTVKADAAATGATWDGDSGWADLGVDRGASTTLAKIRWVIDENYLFGYRAYELIDGGNDDGRSPGYRGQPLAAYAITDHVDIRRDYNPVTGEESQVTVENSSDRRWYERKFMRVDWSQNLISSFTLAANMQELGGWTIEASNYIDTAHSVPQYPRAWAPQFVHVSEDPNYRLADEWAGVEGDPVHYMSFVSVYMFSPGETCLTQGGRCQTYQVPMRTAFLRIPPNHTYAAATETHEEYDRFGLFRTYQSTYVRGGANTDTLRNHCTADADCGSGAGYCDMERNVCAGGLTDDYGETDFLAFYRPRHNFFVKSLTDVSCRQNWECDNRYGDRASSPGAGSVCDPAARRCTIPEAAREIRPVVYHLNEGFPVQLVKPAFEVVGHWNEVFMHGWRATEGRDVPDYASVSMACQNVDPTRFCYCGSADENPTTPGSCQAQYDPFVSPADYTAMGVTDPYDCQIVNNDFSEPDHPTSWADYTIPAAYHYTFQGSECMFVLQSNTCDTLRTDASMACEDVPFDANGDGNIADGEVLEANYEQLGDIRYQFFNYINQSETPFGGVAYPLSDVTNGELITANINAGAGSVEAVGSWALDFFPVLRCANETLGCAPGDENAQEQYLTGDNIQGYFSRLGNTEHAVALAPSGRDGYTTDDPSRPAIPVDLHGAFMERMREAMPRVSALRGSDGRTNIMTDRMRRLAGTHFETDLLESMGTQGREMLQTAYQPQNGITTASAADVDLHNQAVLDQVSPFRGHGLLGVARTSVDREEALARMNMYPTADSQALFRSRYWEYWAEAMRGKAPAEASIRMQQLYLRMVMHHEMGHSVGLRHNFAGSFDRNNYGDGFFNAVVGDPADPSDDLALPDIADYDLPPMGGNGDGETNGPEQDNYRAELRRVRNQRVVRGVSNYMTGSTMDYNGDTADASGLGRYDRAAIIWSYFNLKEAYNGDPRYRSLGSLADVEQPNLVSRTLMRDYRGGDSCTDDEQCPFAQGSASLPAGQGVFQRCIRNPRDERLPRPCAGGRNCICSTFDEDFKDYVVDAAPYNNDVDGVPGVDHFPVNYLFCSDDRTTDISWCNRSDSGESFQEQIDHYRRRWEESYASAYYRRFRRGGARGGSSVGSVIDAAKIYQHLFFRYFYEPGFTYQNGPLGFTDQYMASIDAMNWFTELANLPDEGSYQFNAATNTYDHMGDDTGMAGSDFSFAPGQGFGMWTKYQDGYFGFFRPERAGVFFDKFFGIYALAIRDWNLSYNLDERFYINFYDLFPVEMTEFFGGLALNDPSWFAPRVDTSGADPRVINMTAYRGTCGPPARRVPCLGSQPVEYPQPALGGTSNTVLRSWATILALAQFPVYYDTAFEQRLLIYKLGSGAGFNIPATQVDGSTTCAYGDFRINAGDLLVSDGDPGCTTEQDADYVVYESPRFHTPYVAGKVYSRTTFNLEEEQLGFQLLAQLYDLRTEVEGLPVGPERTRRQADLEQQESFLEYLIDLQSAYGISNTFF